MRFPQVGVRQRILAACLLISLASVAAMTAFGLTLRSVLRARARQSCICIAEMFAAQAHQRLLSLSGESAVLAALVERAEVGGSLCGDPAHSADSRVALCSWALYDPDGRRVERSQHHAALLEDIGIGTEQLVARERGRLEAALAGEPSTVLVPGGSGVYALIYRPARRPGGQTWVLQAAMPATDGDFEASGDVRAVLRPFVQAAAEPRVVAVDGRPRMVVHRPLTFCGRQLGTVSAAVPYDEEARCAQSAALAIIIVAAGATLVLAVLSYVLTDVAMVPLEQIQKFVRNQQAGAEVERPSRVPDDAIGSILETFQEMVDQSQEFADHLMEHNRALHELLTGAVEALVNAVEANDGYTAGHSQRVADRASAIARELGWDHGAIDKFRLGAILHDIGKIGISQDILNKPGPLDPPEWDVIRQHPVIGARILSSIPGCEDIVRIVLHHHEYVDGSGYPAGLAGDEIPVAARIVAIADVYDALTSKRSYRDAYPRAEAVAILEDSAGTMLDPDILAVFLGLLRKDAEIDAPAPDGASERRPEPPASALVASEKETG